jgi:hypothetical protein
VARLGSPRSSAAACGERDGSTATRLTIARPNVVGVSRYDIRYLEICWTARRYGIADEDILHAVEHALAVGEQDDSNVLYLGPDRAANLLEVVSVVREDGSEILIHAMRMRAKMRAVPPR